MDGTESVQLLVQPGETFEYRFVLPDAGRDTRRAIPSTKIDGHGGRGRRNVLRFRGACRSRASIAPPHARRRRVVLVSIRAAEQSRSKGDRRRVAIAAFLRQALQDDGFQIGRQRPSDSGRGCNRLHHEVLAAELENGPTFEDVLAGDEKVGDGGLTSRPVGTRTLPSGRDGSSGWFTCTAMHPAFRTPVRCPGRCPAGTGRSPRLARPRRGTTDAVDLHTRRTT